MLSAPQILQLLDVAAEHGMFVLLEAFDAADLSAARDLLVTRSADNILVGVNCRDLESLEVVPQRFAALAPQLPGTWPAVAESGVACAADAVQMRRLGFRLALIGTALMSRDDPTQLLREILTTARTVQS
jgi:indole-3-glycerol phosphate synthase